jgi:hypothetical protein
MRDDPAPERRERLLTAPAKELADMSIADHPPQQRGRRRLLSPYSEFPLLLTSRSRC